MIVESPKKDLCEDAHHESFEEKDNSNIWSESGPPHPLSWLSDDTTPRLSIGVSYM